MWPEQLGRSKESEPLRTDIVGRGAVTLVRQSAFHLNPIPGTVKLGCNGENRGEFLYPTVKRVEMKTPEKGAWVGLESRI